MMNEKQAACHLIRCSLGVINTANDYHFTAFCQRLTDTKELDRQLTRALQSYQNAQTVLGTIDRKPDTEDLLDQQFLVSLGVATLLTSLLNAFGEDSE